MSPVNTNEYPVMGFDGKMYVGPAGSTSISEMILAECVKDPKYSYKYDEVDATTRKHGGVKAVAKGILDISVSFTLPNVKSSAPDRALIMASLQSRRTPIAICMLDEEDGEGIFGDFELLGGDKSEEDASIQQFEVEAKPSVAGRPVKWTTDGAYPTTT